MVFTPEEARNLFALINRVGNITGTEAPVVVELQNKLKTIMNEEIVVPEVATEEVEPTVSAPEETVTEPVVEPTVEPETI